MYKLILLICAVGIASILGPVEVFAATVNCSSIPTRCVGTDSSDTMTAYGSPAVPYPEKPYYPYNIEANAGSDSVIVNGDLPAIFNITGGEGNDRILVTTTSGSCSNFCNVDGEGGDDVPSVSGTHIGGMGGTGLDRITTSGSPVILYLWQNDERNSADGSRDVLDCKGVLKSTALINLEDGDVAINCKDIITALGY